MHGVRNSRVLFRVYACVYGIIKNIRSVVSGSAVWIGGRKVVYTGTYLIFKKFIPAVSAAVFVLAGHGVAGVFFADLFLYDTQVFQ